MNDTVPSNRTTIIGNIIRERMRQCQELGYTPEHDDRQVRGQLADAAACYAANNDVCYKNGYPMWPWSDNLMKRKDRLTDLTRAAALIVAEMERIMRAEDRTTTEKEESDA